MGSGYGGEMDEVRSVSMVRTTVVIPNYKGIDYIDACLRSLYEGSVPIQVILVDNASNDGSLALVKENFPQVKIIAFTENKGFSGAVNAGIREAETEYVLLLNNDTVAAPKLVEQLECALDAHPEAFSVAAKMLQLKNPEKLDGAGDFYCALGWAFARGKDRPCGNYDQPDRIFLPARDALCTGRACFQKLVISMKTILHIWKILISGIVPIFVDILIDMSRRLWFIMPEARSVVRDIIHLK